MPVATESTQEYRDLRELLDTGSSGGGPSVEEAERKQALMVFGGAAAVVLLVIVGLVALPKDDDKDGGSNASADTEQTAGEESANTEQESPTATTLAPVATPEGLSAFNYEVPSANVLPELKPGDTVDFFLSADLVAANILVKGIGGENEVLAGFPMRQLTLAASPDDMRKLNGALPKTKRSMATAAAPAPAPAPDPAAPPATDPAAPPG